jgi:hexosaminidase
MPDLGIWPLPQLVVGGPGGPTPACLSPYFSFACAGLCPAPLPAAFDRYGGLLFFAGSPTDATAGVGFITVLNFTISSNASLAFGVSENYTLNIPNGLDGNGAASVVADTVWGALRALESFSQLFLWSGRGAPVSYCTTRANIDMYDYPRYPWRGLLIDSARHFLPVPAIEVTLDAMSYNKLNTLHWHLVDDQSWPLYSAQYPNFTKGGAYCTDCFYTHQDLQRVVDYAFERGIRVIPEFDMPGHAAIWGKGYPQLEITCPGGQSLLNPIDDGSAYSTYTVIDNLLTEYAPIFYTADTVHFGGDEVSSLQCWNESTAVQAFMALQNITTVDALRNYFEDKIQTIATSHGLRSMFWEEVFDKGYNVHPTSIVDVWLSFTEVDAVVAKGNNVVVSYGLYLDQQTPVGPTHYFWADTVRRKDCPCARALQPVLYCPISPHFPSLPPPPQLQFLNFWENGSTNPSPLILGESLSQWGEQVDASNIESRIWPRASGGAERMWGNYTGPDYANALLGRLERFRCTMHQRGVGAGPLRPASDFG